MIIEATEIKLPPDKVLKIESYKDYDEGIYIVNDGISKLLVSYVDGYIGSIPLPLKCIVVEENKKAIFNYQKETLRLFNKIEDRIINLDIEKKDEHKRDIDINALAKLISVSKKPEMLKEILDEETKRFQ